MKLKGDRRKPVLIVQHAPHEHPAALRRALESQGIMTLVTEVFKGESLPDASQIRGLVSLGGPMGAHDEEDHDWIFSEIELMKRCFSEEKPIAGICLGGQLLARSLGAHVVKNPEPEIGWFPIELTSHGKDDCILSAAGTAPLVYHWHYDTFHLPAGATLLASSEGCGHQAFRVGDRAYGFQFHPEADRQLVLEWLSIEGVEDEINCDLKKYPGGYIQTPLEHSETARSGEHSSLKIATGIAQLFQDNVYNPVDAISHEQLNTWRQQHALLVIEFEGSNRKKAQIRGKILEILTVYDGEFLIFEDDNGLAWPIRLDHISKTTPV